MNQCAFDGFLVSGQKLLPANAFDFGWADADILIGCNQLRCDECGQPVRSRALTAPTTPGIKHIREIYDTADWQKFFADKWLQGHDWGRFYICRCNVVTELDFRHTHD